MTKEQGKKQKGFNKGDYLEYRAKRLLFHMGYYTTQGVIVKSSLKDAYDVVTDLDVYGVYIHKDFRKKSVWLDCKSGFTKPLERISWIKGVKQEVDADDAIFITKRIRDTVKTFARDSSIQIFDRDMLSQIEESYGIGEDDWKGSWNPDTMNNKIKTFSQLNSPDNKHFKDIANFISSDYWAIDYYSQVKKVITALKTINNETPPSLREEDSKAFMWSIYKLIILFTLSLLNISRELYFFSEEERNTQLLDGLLSSDIPLKRRNEILKASYSLAYELVRDKFPDTKFSFDKDMINIAPPSYFEALKDLLSRVIKNPFTYYDILRSMDFLLMEYDLNQKGYNEKEILNYCSKFEENKVGLKSIFHFINQVTGIPKDYFQIIS
ncbi:hypothetical protein [Sediminibacillus terrae]|uniref:hypothetical protein n=1 Tax=Sediminibacillus terrae TaxID=1562106 RepID=UPI001296065F|nr:hypothetical protein [Sediminibacillus terrae]